MNASIFEIRNIRPAACVALLACALALAGCQTDGASPTASDAPKAEAAAAAKPEAAAPKPQAAKPAEPESDEPMTRTRAARECWMKTEKASAREDLDKRADLVNKCIDDKLKAAGAPPPKT